MIGIYSIINNANNKCYIGQSFNIALRFSQHKSKLKKNKHANKHLQNAWNKYGENCFKFEIIEECCPLLLNKKEIDYINAYNSIKNGYNKKTGGDRDFIMSEESKIKSSISHKGQHSSPETEFKKGIIPPFKGEKGIHLSPSTEFKKGHIPWLKGTKGLYISSRRKKCYQYDLDYNLINEFVSLDEAEIKTGVSKSNICAACKGKYKTMNGFIWSYDKIKANQTEEKK